MSDSLQQLIDRCAPERILAIGPLAHDAALGYAKTRSRCIVDQAASDIACDRLSEYGVYDLVIASHLIEFRDETEAGHIIGQLRDLHGPRLLLIVPVGRGWPNHKSRWDMADLLAYGLYHVASVSRDGRTVDVYGYDIAHYKITPDWLNADHWANPELFNKYWW